MIAAAQVIALHLLRDPASPRGIAHILRPEYRAILPDGLMGNYDREAICLGDPGTGLGHPRVRAFTLPPVVSVGRPAPTYGSFFPVPRSITWLLSRI